MNATCGVSKTHPKTLVGSECAIIHHRGAVDEITSANGQGRVEYPPAPFFGAGQSPASVFSGYWVPFWGKGASKELLRRSVGLSCQRSNPCPPAIFAISTLIPRF